MIKKFIKSIALVFIACICMMSVSAYVHDDSYNLRLGSIRSGFYDDEVEIHYNMGNLGAEDIDNARVIFWIPDLDYYIKTSQYDIQSNDNVGHLFYPEESGLQPGVYFTRVTATSDFSRDTHWIWLEIE